MDGLRAANGRGAGSSRRRDQNGRLSREDSNVKGVAKVQSGGGSSGLLEAPFACASGKALRPCGAARCAEGGGAGSRAGAEQEERRGQGVRLWGIAARRVCSQSGHSNPGTGMEEDSCSEKLHFC